MPISRLPKNIIKKRVINILMNLSFRAAVGPKDHKLDGRRALSLGFATSTHSIRKHPTPVNNFYFSHGRIFVKVLKTKDSNVCFPDFHEFEFAIGANSYVLKDRYLARLSLLYSHPTQHRRHE